MINYEELYDNLEVFISNLEILLTKNIFNGDFQQEIKNFGTELFNICKQRKFNVVLTDIQSTSSFIELFNHTPKQSQIYLTTTIEKFFCDIIEPTKFDNE